MNTTITLFEIVRRQLQEMTYEGVKSGPVEYLLKFQVTWQLARPVQSFITCRPEDVPILAQAFTAPVWRGYNGGYFSLPDRWWEGKLPNINVKMIDQLPAAQALATV